MTVGVAQHRINEMKNIAEKLGNSMTKIQNEEDKNKVKSLEDNYGITLDLLHEALQFLSITARNFQKDLDDCDVDCQCW